ncbi:MAG TPA: GGDEF domain-containing protein [Vicinamibacteria bacterium]
MKPVLSQSNDAIAGSAHEEAGLRLLVEQAGVLAWTTDRELRVTWGLRSPALTGLEQRLDALLGAGDAAVPAVAAHRRALGGQPAEFDLEWKGRGLRVRVEPLRHGDQIAGAVAVALERSAPPPPLGEEPPEVAQGRDAVTGLPGRAPFLDRLRRCIAPGWCAEGLFVLLLDLDRFKEVNERYGFAGGDELLAAVGARLGGRVRAVDTVARFGPDEFAVLLTRVRSGHDAARVAERLLAELHAPFDVQGRLVSASACIGIAAGAPGARPEDVLREAERALARAQVLGRPGYQTLPSVSDAREAALLQVEAVLRRALDQAEIQASYRPTVLRKEGRVPGFDVVLWRRAPAAEEGKPLPQPMRQAG